MAIKEQNKYFLRQKCQPDFILFEYSPLEKLLVQASARQQVAVLAHSSGESTSGAGGGRKKQRTFPSKCKHEALADLRSTMITGFGFPQSSLLEILDGAE